MTADDVSQLIHRSRTRISRMRPDVGDTMRMLDRLEITGEKYHQILRIAPDATESGQWDDIGTAMGARQRLYADVESGVDGMRSYSQISIPGLLQSPRLTRALIEEDERDGELSYVPEKSMEARRRI